mmetsp:Transcript_4421/g.6475  ORF Transcript_4421/g.6475 Transcript_4421/m.6475 type:complete len:189 (+) Transcript_4421:429-995(+)
MAFKGDFEKLDDEIKVQVKALHHSDVETMRRIHTQEMSIDEQKIYLMDDATKLRKLKEKEEAYDSDLDRTLYQEFWSELRKEKPQIRESKSVMRGPVRPLDTAHDTLSVLDQHSLNYGTTPKGIAGPLGGLDLQTIQQQRDFKVRIMDPMSPMNREINSQMIKPRKRFNTIFEEHVELRKKFDHEKKA